jgi:hypothetical protein
MVELVLLKKNASFSVDLLYIHFDLGAFIGVKSWMSTD